MAVLMDAPPVAYDVGQPDFDFEVGRRLRVFLDGVEQKMVMSYDIERGQVVRQKPGPDGGPIPDETGESVAVETLEGVVTVEWKVA